MVDLFLAALHKLGIVSSYGPWFALIFYLAVHHRDRKAPADPWSEI